jgi:predicted amidohydrolase
MAREPKRWRVAALQVTATTDVDRNLRRARRLIHRAADRGARLIALPENFAYLREEGSEISFKQKLDGELVCSFREDANRLGRYLLLGSFPETIRRSRRIHNTSVLIGPDGALLAVYRKMHLFDINIRGGAVLRESRTVAPGDRPVVASTELGKLGLSICYDLRFPELYRQLALAGAEVIFVPAAFTAYTGPHHWMPLLRARAIENQCWVVAPAQVGRHSAKRRSHGETAIIDPWGRIVARKGSAEGIVEAEIDRSVTAKVRRGLPCLDHVRRELLGKPG